MELGVIKPVQEATEWCAGMVEVDGKIRICVDVTKLNFLKVYVEIELQMLSCMEL